MILDLVDTVCLNLSIIDFKKMINQIYHTSHSGSTLLIYLLRKNIKVYSEPYWSHEIIRNNSDSIFFESISQYDSGIIKLPSGLCHFAHKTTGKKMFLYRQLKQHLFQILSKRMTVHYIDYYYSYFKKNTHPSLKTIEFDSIEKKNIFLWANRIMWILECQNILWMNTNIFLTNKKKSLNYICDHFEISKINNVDIPNVHVKSIGMNHQNLDLNQVIPNMNNAIQVDENYGIISDEICFDNNQICQLLDWAHENLTFIPKYLF